EEIMKLDFDLGEEEQHPSTLSFGLDKTSKPKEEKPKGGYWDEKQIWHPDVAPKERVDTNILGVDYNKLSDLASKLPRGLQYPVGAATGLAGNLIEQAS